ncbi:uncharacterized protein B0T23DRAFT_381361 [Neurospora hispaniola]|uniref:BTB domain-containing protein n=1 Tax=Neurospora hispaniola TaxID=588809 RepID=A0AAJ0I4Q8_9PEZI|nr:hypothetical protein B0T23DRAFT_381361 [Neurospora hispaniola]
MSTPINGVGGTDLEIIEIVPNGDIILDVTFETSKPVILAAKKAFAAFSSRPTPRTSKATIPGQGPAKTPVRPPRPPPKPRERVGFRVHLSVLKEQSPYFARLLSDTRFAEAKAVEAALAKLSLENISPGEADWTQLPRVSIREDDEATQSAEMRYIFHDLLYILHHGRVPPPADETSAEPPAEVTPPEPTAAAPTPKPVVSKPAATTKEQKPGQKLPTKTPAKGTQSNGLRKPLDKTSQKGQPKPTLQKPETPDEPVTTELAPTAPPLTIPYLTTLSLLADRFSCTPSLSRLPSSSQTPLKWPATPTRLTKDQDGHALTFAGEELLRQKILVSWLLDLPLKFQSATRELILYGSRRWTLSASPEDSDSESDYTSSDPNPVPNSHPEKYTGNKYKHKYKAKWWSLPDLLEDELSYRRTCLLSVLASIPRHFLRLYIVRPPQTRSIVTSSAGIGSSFTSNAASALQAAAQGRQCKLGYESSASCDSYQLGEMIRFLCTKGLLALVDFSPSSFDRAITQYDGGGENPLAKVDGHNPGMGVVFGPPKHSSGIRGENNDLGGISTMEINHFVAILRQCPSYQIDRHHTNCGLRTRMLPVLDYVQAMLNSEVVLVKRADWEKRREEVSWVSLVERRQEEGEDGGRGEKGKNRVFRFTRTLAADPRMRYNSTLGTSKMAMELFLADEWDWTAEEY